MPPQVVHRRSKCPTSEVRHVGRKSIFVHSLAFGLGAKSLVGTLFRPGSRFVWKITSDRNTSVGFEVKNSRGPTRFVQRTISVGIIMSDKASSSVSEPP